MSDDELVRLTLVPVEVFGAGICGQGCEHCDTHEGYGLSDAVQAWSDCNRAAGRIYRVDEPEMEQYRTPGETVVIYVRPEDVAWFERRWGEDG